MAKKNGVVLILGMAIFIMVMVLTLVNARIIADCHSSRPWRDPQTNICECASPGCIDGPRFCGDGFCDGREDISNCVPDCDPNYVSQKDLNQLRQKADSNNVVMASLIGGGIVVGLIILGLILRRKKE